MSLIYFRESIGLMLGEGPDDLPTPTRDILMSLSKLDDEAAFVAKVAELADLPDLPVASRPHLLVLCIEIFLDAHEWHLLRRFLPRARTALYGMHARERMRDDMLGCVSLAEVECDWHSGKRAAAIRKAKALRLRRSAYFYHESHTIQGKHALSQNNITNAVACLNMSIPPSNKDMEILILRGPRFELCNALKEAGVSEHDLAPFMEWAYSFNWIGRARAAPNV